MQDEEAYKKTPEYLLHRVEALETMLSAIITTLPDKQRNFLMYAADAYYQNQKIQLEWKETDPARDEASAAYELAERIRKALSGWGEEWSEWQAENSA